MAEYPEHEKLKKINHKSQIMGDFLEFCGFPYQDFRPSYTQKVMEYVIQFEEHNKSIAKFSIKDTVKEINRFLKWLIKQQKKNTCYKHKGINRVLADFYGIDHQKLEDEKQKMLEEIRNVNQIA